MSHVDVGHSGATIGIGHGVGIGSRTPVKEPVPAYGAVPPPPETLTEVVPPKQAMAPDVEAAVSNVG